MIDHEFRVLTPSVKKIIKKNLLSEEVLNEKIPYKLVNSSIYKKSYQKYLNYAKEINLVYLRGLPINNKKIYISQERELKFEFFKIIGSVNRKIKYKQVIQIPNPEYVSVKDFKNLIKKIDNLGGFELISSWHNKFTGDTIYDKYLKVVKSFNLPVSIEVDYIHRNSKNSISEFFKLLRKNSSLKFWLPHFGCGAFLHWKLIKQIAKKKPVLLSSTSEIEYWLNIFSEKNFRDIPIKFASDHPFNSYQSEKIYNNWMKLKK